MYIQQVVDATIETDIPQYADLSVSTARKLKRLLGIIAQSSPFKPNMSQIGGQLEVSRNNVADLCVYLEKAGLIDFLIDGKYTFEVGGKKKKQRQLQNIENGFVVKDDIETGYGNIIPLWMFGMLY